MKVKVNSVKHKLKLPTVGSLDGGQAFQLIANGAVYIRATAATSQLGIPSCKKIAVSLTTGSIAVLKADKPVIPVEAEVTVESIYAESSYCQP